MVMTRNSRAPKDHINIKIAQKMISGIPLVLEPECEILMFMWSAVPLNRTPDRGGH